MGTFRRCHQGGCDRQIHQRSDDKGIKHEYLKVLRRVHPAGDCRPPKVSLVVQSQQSIANGLSNDGNFPKPSSRGAHCFEKHQTNGSGKF